MIKFKTDESLGKVVEPNFKMYCAIGIDPITKMEQLKNAAGATKFGQLCGFAFKSLNTNIDYQDFTVSFVSKIRSKIYRRDPNNETRWFVFKCLSLIEKDVLDKQSTLINYGFDVDKFMNSDVMAAAIPQFTKTITKGLGDCRKFAESLKNPLEKAEAMIYIKSIEESIPLLSSKKVNDKYFKLKNLDVHLIGATKKLLDAITKKKLSSINKVNTKWMNKAHGDEEKYVDRDQIDFSDESENLNETAFNFDRYDWKDGSITGKGLTKLLSDTSKYADANAIKIYDRNSNKYFNIVDCHIDVKNSGLVLEIDGSRESQGRHGVDGIEPPKPSWLKEADESDLLGHALDPVGVKASTANTIDQDAVAMSIVEDEIDAEIEEAVKEIYK